MRAGLNHLVRAEPVFATIVDRWGPPPLWHRGPGFATLIHIMLEQQVSLASALATLHRIRTAAGTLTPEAVLTLGEPGLRAAGVTRQKTRYLLALADAVHKDALDLNNLHQRTDLEADAALTALPGIGRWTSNIYLMSALRRPDIWPTGDLAVAIAIRDLWHLPATPTHIEAETRAEPWRPWRAEAARLLWHHYLSVRRPRT